VFFYDKIYGLSYIVLNIGIDPSTMSASNMALDFKKLQARYPCNEKTDPYDFERIKSSAKVWNPPEPAIS